MQQFHLRLPCDVPELDIRAGDSIDYHPSTPDTVYVVRRISKARTLSVLTRYRSVSRHLPRGLLPVPEPQPLRLVK